jgi:hypothetical protein
MIRKIAKTPQLLLVLQNSMVPEEHGIGKEKCEGLIVQVVLIHSL